MKAGWGQIGLLALRGLEFTCWEVKPPVLSQWKWNEWDGFSRRQIRARWPPHLTTCPEAPCPQEREPQARPPSTQ